MINQILADYYEQNLLLKKAQRLRKRNVLAIYGWYAQYTYQLGEKSSCHYQKGDGWFVCGYGCGYSKGNGWIYR